jgi:hypothetical protein
MLLRPIYGNEKKSSGHALADALEEATGEIKASRQVMVDMGRTPTANAAKILVSEFGYLSGTDQDLIYAALGKDGQADLFLVRSWEERRLWVNRTLSAAKGLPDDDQPIGHQADDSEELTANPGESDSTESDDDLDAY